MAANAQKRTIDMEIIEEWVERRSRVVDLGCGEGELLAHLKLTKDISEIGVDLDFAKVAACVRKGVTAYQGDMTGFLRNFPDRHFDRVICSRTVHELADPTAVLSEALRVSRAVTIGFVNHGYWKNRLGMLVRGRKIQNSVYPTDWYESRPANPVTIADFENFCRVKSIRVARRVHLLGDWRTPCPFRPNLLAGYALYDLTR